MGLDGVVGEDNCFQFLGIPADFVLGEFRHVVGLEQPVVLVRVFLGKEEWLVGVALLVKVCQIQAGVCAVFPAGSESYPPGIGRPALEAFRPGGVQSVKRFGLKGLEISDIDIPYSPTPLSRYLPSGDGRGVTALRLSAGASKITRGSPQALVAGLKSIA